MPERPRTTRPSVQNRTRTDNAPSARSAANGSRRPAPQQPTSQRRRPSSDYAGRQQAGRPSQDYARRQATRPSSQARTRAPQRARATAQPSSPNKLLPFAGIAVAVIAVIALFVLFVLPQCTASKITPDNAAAGNTAPANTTQGQATTQAAARPSVEELVASLPDVIEDEDKLALAQRAQTDDDALWIAEHADEYDFIDDYIQWKMLRLAAYEGDSVDFVRHVMDRYPAAEAGTWKGTLGQGVPHLYQWDTAWADTEYCGLPFGMSGCAPTAFSMVAMALTGSTECTPYVAGQDAMKSGYAIEYIGSNGSFFTDRCGNFGFSCYSAGLTGDGLKDALKNGALVVCNVGPGDFTVGGHFIVATGVADNGEVVINDPYSTTKSAQTWDANRIANQTKVFYVCTK